MEQILKVLRKEILYLSYRCQDGNLQSAFSCVDIIWVLYDRIMNWSVEEALNEERDFCIISKGQATLALYAVLIEKKMFPMDIIAKEIGKFDSKYCIQADLTKFHGGIENSAGSLGHGLPFAVGIAYANKVKKMNSNVYVLCGDGEFCEGTMWESCIFASAKKLDNICIIIDDNNSVGKMVSLGNLKKKFEAFEFDVREVDGHDINKLESTLNEIMKLKNGNPKLIIAHTIRGYGSETMTKFDVWFHKAPNRNELEQLEREIDKF